MFRDIESGVQSRCAERRCNNQLPFLWTSRYCSPCLNARKTKQEMDDLAKSIKESKIDKEPATDKE